MANAPTVELETRSVMRVSLQPGDVLVIQCEGNLPEAARKRLSDSLSKLFPGHQVLILERGITLSVVGSAE